MALRAHGRTLFPHCHCLRDIRCRPNHLHVDASNRAPILCHVPASHGLFLSLSADIAVGVGDCCSPKGEESGSPGFGDGGVECYEYCYCVSLSRVERTVSIRYSLRFRQLTNLFSLYRMGCIVLTVALLCCATASITLRFWLQKLNRKSDQIVGLEGVVNGSGLLFRYTL